MHIILYIVHSLSHTHTHTHTQETFESGLTTFHQEGIGSLAAMKDRLLAAQHPQSKQIQHRYADVIRRWGVGWDWGCSKQIGNGLLITEWGTMSMLQVGKATERL